MSKFVLFAAVSGLVFQGSLSLAMCGSPDSFHRPAGLGSQNQPRNYVPFRERASGIQDSALNCLVIISRDYRSPASDSVTIFIDRNNVGTIPNAGKFRFKVPPGQHFFILSLEDQYYIDRVAFVPYGAVVVSYSFPFPVQDSVFLYAVSLTGEEQSTYMENEQYRESFGNAKETAPVFYGNGNLLMSRKLFNSLTSSYYNGQKVVNLEYDRKKALELMNPGPYQNVHPMFR
jgi:hypothetical protein